MLLIRMSSFPKITVGRTIEYPRPESRIISSTLALPRKYSKGESFDGFVMLTCTIRRTPASLAARMRVSLFATARSKVTSRRGNRTQYVLYSVVAPIAERVRAVRVAGERLHAPAGLQQASGDVPARVAECPRHDVNVGHRDRAASQPASASV